MNFTSHQLAHHVPCKNSEVNRVRTGTEAVLASFLSGMFSVSAPSNGTVIEIDEKHGILHFRPDPITLTVKGKVSLPLTGDKLADAAKKHSRIYVLMDKPPAQVHESLQAAKGIAATVLGITPQSNPRALPLEIQKTYDGDVTKAKYLIEIGLSDVTVHPADTYYEYGVQYSELSGSQMRQDLTLNVKKGDKVKKGDILIYNEGFFSPVGDPWDPAGEKGVNWNHGVMVNIVLQERTGNYEDAAVVTSHLTDLLDMHPAHVRRIETTIDTAVENLAEVGSKISATDPLCFLRDGTVTDMSDDGLDGSSFFFDAMTKTPVRARYSGKVAKIEILYATDPSRMSDSLKKLVRKYEERKKAIVALSKKSGNRLSVRSGFVPPGTKYQGVEFTPETVMIEVTIEETYPAGQADKICFMTSAKATISNVTTQRARGATSGRPIDGWFSATSLFKRMLMTPFLNGKANLTTIDAEKKLASILFD